jgi:hypothetical protein
MPQDQASLEAFPKPVDMSAGGAQSRHDDDCLSTQMKSGVERQCQQIHTLCCDVFAEVSGENIKALCCQSLKKFGLHEVDLTQIR